MKVNFWQVLGLVLIVIGVVLFFRDRTGKDTVNSGAGTPTQTSPPTTTTTAPVAP